LRTFGEPELLGIAEDGSTRPLLPRGKLLAVLVYCACAGRREYSRDAIATMLWSDAPAERARHNVRQAVWRLRKILGDALVTRDETVISLGATVRTDRERFLQAVYQHDAKAALEWYAGGFLAGFSIPGAEEFDDWVVGERRRLDDALLRVVEPAVKGESLRFGPTEQRQMLETLVGKMPEHPEARRIAIEVFLDLAEVAAARREADALEQLARRLDEPLSPAAAAVVARARNFDESDSAREAAGIFLDLVGRDDEFARVMDAWVLAKRKQPQIMILTGPAGIGKSRLLHAIRARCAGRRALALTVRASSGEQQVPYGFAAHIAHALAMQAGAAGVNADSARELVALDPSLGRQYAVAPSGQEGGEAVRRRALAVLDLMTAVAEQAPLALLLDDVHWADPASTQLLSIALGRLIDVPILVVGTARSSTTTWFDHPAETEVPLSPLSIEARTEAILSSGEWPEHPDAQQCLQLLAAACDGVPLSILDRLSFVQDTGSLSLRDGRWHADDWSRVANDIAVSSPLTQRLAACSADEQRILLRLAVAGTPLSPEILLAPTTPSGIARALHDALASLQQKGLVVHTVDRYEPSHDAVPEQTLARLDVATVQDAHRQLAEALVTFPAPNALKAGLRHFVRAAALERAAQTFSSIVTRARRSGDTRHARDLLAEALGEQLPPATRDVLLSALPWYRRSARIALNLGVAASVAVSLGLAGWSWQTLRTPTLKIRQAGAVTVIAPLYGENAFRFVPSIIVEGVAEGPVPSRAPRVVRVRSLRPSTTILSGDSAVVENGTASFGGLRIRTRDSIVALQFEGEGARSVSFRLAPSAVRNPERLGRSRARLVEAQFGTQRVRGPQARIIVRPGEMISGVVQLQYTARWAAASVWASMTPSWGEAQEVGRELIPVATPVTQDIVDLPVDVRAPLVTGRYWLLFMVDAEPSGGFALSRTNWTLGEPLWNDGNDVARLSDSTIRQANEDGAAIAPIALPKGWLRGEACQPSDRRVRGVEIKYCAGELPMFGIEVVVR
jgi:DNA-binding SARP family transcriptional activator